MNVHSSHPISPLSQQETLPNADQGVQTKQQSVPVKEFAQTVHIFALQRQFAARMAEKAKVTVTSFPAMTHLSEFSSKILDRVKNFSQETMAWTKTGFKSTSENIKQLVRTLKPKEESYLKPIDLSRYNLGGDSQSYLLISSANRIYQKIAHDTESLKGAKSQQLTTLKDNMKWVDYKINQLNQALENPRTEDIKELLTKQIEEFKDLKKAIEDKMQTLEPHSAPAAAGAVAAQPTSVEPKMTKEEIRQQFNQLVKYARQLDNEKLEDTHKLVFKKPEGFQLVERQFGLHQRRGTSAGAERTLEQVVQIIKEGWATKALNAQDINDIENLRLRLTREDQLGPSLAYQAELNEDFNRTLDKIRVETSMAPVIADNEKMVHVFEDGQTQNAISSLLSLIGHQVLTNSDGEHFSWEKARTATKDLSKTVEDYQSFLSGTRTEIPEAGLGATKILKGFTRELLKQAAEKLDPQYKTSNSEVSQKWKVIQQAFENNAKLTNAIPLDWKQLQDAIIWMAAQRK